MFNQCQFFLRALGFLLVFALLNSWASRYALAQGASTLSPDASVAIVTLEGLVLVGEPVIFKVNGDLENLQWDLGDGFTAEGTSVTHTLESQGVYQVVT